MIPPDVEELLVRLLQHSYVDTEFQGKLRFVVDGSIHDVTQEEIDAFDRWWDERVNQDDDP